MKYSLFDIVLHDEDILKWTKLKNITNVIKSIRKNALDYNVFKQQFLSVFENIEVSGTPRDDVDSILYSMSVNQNPNSAYYYSDMAGFGKTLTPTVYKVNAFDQTVFGIQSNFNLTQNSNRSVYVYHNGVHLINGVDYNFDPTDNTVNFVNVNTFLSDFLIHFLSFFVCLQQSFIIYNG